MVRNSTRISKIIWDENKFLVTLLTFTFLVVSATPFIQSGASALLINSLVENGIREIDMSKILILVAILIAANFIPAIFRIIQDYISKIFFFFLDKKIHILFNARKGEIDVAAHENPEIGNLLTRIDEQGRWKVRDFADRQYYLIQNIAETVIASIILAFASWWVFLIIFVFTIPELLAEARYGRENWGIWTGNAQARRRFWNLQEHFTNISKLTELKLFQNTSYFVSIIDEILTLFQRKSIEKENQKAVYKLLASIPAQLAIAFAIFWFILQVVHGDLLVGTLIFILAAMGNFRQSLAGLFMNLGKQYEDNFFVSDFFRLMDLPPTIQKPVAGLKLDPKKTPEIIFDNVTFSYPGTNRVVLKNISIKISPGEKIAIVGINGAGKTTFVKLLCRFYDPTEGKITIDGHDLKDIDLESWYYQLGIIFQDYAQYNFIVKEAIALGRTTDRTADRDDKGKNIAKVQESAEAAEADVFIKEWEKKYEQMLGKEFSEGIEPSIGQWQKLALARTFYRDPRILVLDEPTSSIDAEAEAKIFEKLEALPEDRTVILISHRFSTVRKANQIVIIEDGSIKELGTHEDLLKLNGTYARLFNIQAEGYK